MMVDLAVQVFSIDYPVNQTKDWHGGRAAIGVCPCYIYEKSTMTNAEELAKLHMVPPGYLSLQD